MQEKIKHREFFAILRVFGMKNIADYRIPSRREYSRRRVKHREVLYKLLISSSNSQIIATEFVEADGPVGRLPDHPQTVVFQVAAAAHIANPVLVPHLSFHLKVVDFASSCNRSNKRMLTVRSNSFKTVKMENGWDVFGSTVEPEPTALGALSQVAAIY